MATMLLAGMSLASLNAQAPAPQPPPPGTIVCASPATARHHCAADTSAGVVLAKSTGTAACLLGKTWGYDDQGVWVSDGCSGRVPDRRGRGCGVPRPAVPVRRRRTERIETWGEFDPGNGFLVGRSSAGELSISAYALVRYLNQMPGDETFTDHLGNERAVDGRNDIFPHRVIVWFKGWVGRPQICLQHRPLDGEHHQPGARSSATSATSSVAKFSLYARHQRQSRHALAAGLASVLARPRPRDGRRVLPSVLRLRCLGAGRGRCPASGTTSMIGNNNSALDVKATQLDRSFTPSALDVVDADDEGVRAQGRLRRLGAAREAGDAVRLLQLVQPEQRYTNADNGSSGNTTLRLADSVNVFDTGALAPGVTVDEVDFRILSFDAGIKYKGFFLQTEIYNRWLDNFVADGPLPVSSIHDRGFYVQGSFYPVPKKLEALRRHVADFR